MDENKVPKQVWWAGAVVAVATLVAGYFYTKKKAKRKSKRDNAESAIPSKRISAVLSRQFSMGIGETAYVSDEGLEIIFDSVLADGNPTITLHLVQDIAGVMESGGLQVSVENRDGRSNCVDTNDLLISRYKVMLLNYAAGIASLVVSKDK
jgi:hypothetical protein